MGENFGLFKSFGDKLFEGETPTNLGLIGSFIADDADTVAFFNRVTAAGGSLTLTEKDAIAALVVQLKDAGLWTGMKAIYPMVGSSAAACAQNLKSASYTGSFSSGWTFASTGATPNGTSAYMDTNLNAFSALTPSNWHLSYYSRTNISGEIFDFGTGDSLGNYSSSLILRRAADVTAFDSGNATGTNRISSTTADSRGFFIGKITNSSDRKYLRNNALLVSSTATNTNVLQSYNLYLGCYNQVGTPIYFSSKQNAFASIGDGLTDTQAADLYTAVQAFQTTLGRQIVPNDTDAQAFFDRVTAAGGSLTATEQNAVNALVIDMKATGTWTSMKAIYPMVGGSSAACSQNLKSSSFTGTFTSGWSFSSLGVTPNGSSAYMNTNFIPSTHLSVDSTHASLYLNTNNLQATTDPVDLGSFNSVSQTLLLAQSTISLSFSSRNLGNLIATTQPTRAGFGITSKTSATVTTLYKNGVNVASGNSGGTLPTFDCYLANLSIGGSPYVAGYTNNRIAFHSIGDGLDATQATNLYNSVQTFQTTLSRQV